MCSSGVLALRHTWHGHGTGFVEQRIGRTKKFNRQKDGMFMYGGEAYPTLKQVAWVLLYLIRNGVQ